MSLSSVTFYLYSLENPFFSSSWELQSWRSADQYSRMLALLRWEKNKTEIFTHTPFLLIHVAKQRMVFRSNTFPNNLIKQQIDLYRKSGLVNLAVEMWYVASLIRWDFCLIRWLMRKFFCCDLLLVNSHGYNQTICA